MKTTSTTVALLGFIVMCLCVELLGGWFTSLGVHTWYPTLNKPDWNPPNWVFGPVWTILYLMMAFAIWLIWKENTIQPKRWAYFLFGIQLFLNLIWSAIFFTFHHISLSVLDISLLWVLVIATILSFWRIRPLAGLLLVPYLLWISYALALNHMIWQLNPGV